MTLHRFSYHNWLCRRLALRATKKFRKQYVIFTTSGVLFLCSALGAWKKNSILLQYIYYNFEGVSPAESHKPNKVFQRLFTTRMQGSKKLSMKQEPDNGGSSMAFAGTFFEIEFQV